MSAFRSISRIWVAFGFAALMVVIIPTSPALAAPGDLDPSFSGDGIAVTPLTTAFDDEINAVAVQPDGKIVVAGFAIFSGTNKDFALGRYNPNGSLDTSFDGDGLVSTPIGSGDDVARAVAIQPDGKIVAAGYSSIGSTIDFALARYSPTGTLEFAVTTPIGSGTDIANAVAIQPDGKIVAAGYSFIGTTDDFALVRYTSTGTLDTTFNGDGKLTTPIGFGDDQANAMAIQADGKIVAAGFNVGSNGDFALVRYAASGALDTTFGSGGRVITPIGSSDDHANAMALQADGRIVAAGFTSSGSNDDFALARYTTAGALDGTFGSGGKVVTPIGPATDGANAVAIQPDGKIVVAGESNVIGSVVFALARYTTTGALDATFGSNGKVMTPIGSFADQANAVAIQSDGRIVAAGSSYNGPDKDFAVTRYLADPPTISVADSSVTEGNTGTVNMAFTVSLAGTGGNDYVTVDYATVADTATSADIVATAGTLKFAVGQTVKTINVPIKGDTTSEPSETFSVRLSNPQGATLEDPLGIGTITDNDGVPAISISNVSVAEGTSGTVGATFTLTLSNPSSDYVSVDYETADETATAPSDYQAKSGTRWFPPGQTVRSVTVSVKGDTTQEPNETFRLRLFDPNGATLFQTSGTGTILDDDKPVISITGGSVTEANTGTNRTLNFTVTLNHAGTSTVTVAYNTQNFTATAPGDYTAKSGTLTFSVGQTSKAVPVTVKGDNVCESGGEAFLMVLSSPTNATLSKDGSSDYGTIIDNDC